MMPLFALTTLASAFLLFWIEPLFAKMVLPLLGGSPAVWNTCLMYFQATLLAGYLYAHLTSRWLSARRQALLHVGLLVVALISLPIVIPATWTPPATGNVIPWMIALLTVAIGAPFMLLAATAPLVQRWLANSDHPSAHNPYLLYAASNTGSLIGLLGFPIIMEPNLRLSQQASYWGFGYIVAIVLAAGCAGFVWKRSQPFVALATIPVEATSASPSMRNRLKWIVLAFVPSSLLLGVTTYISTDVAAMPLLWVVPLALYLITFIIVFGRTNREPSRGSAIVHAVLLTILVLVMFWGPGMALRTRVLLHLGVFATTALVLHGELAASRPAPKYLTEFYLWMALGGALGGVFNAVVAPLLFDSVVEYQLVLMAAPFLRPSWRWRVTEVLASNRLTPVAAIPALIVGSVMLLEIANEHVLGVSIKLLVSIVAAAMMIALSGDARRFGSSLAAVMLVSFAVAQRYDRDLFEGRSFFGAYRVQRVYGPVHRLVHGTTTHGAQYQDSARRRTPVTYYHPAGPVGQLFAALNSSLAGRNIGAVGLGAGSVLCYSKPGQSWTFFEIDPMVERIASDPKLFTYMRDCGVKPQIVIGDARLTLAREPGKRFALLIVDAFSSDAIPVHLLTREAFRVYQRVLDDRGVLFVHISNKHLDLQPVVAGLVADAGLVALLQEHEPSDTAQYQELDYPAEWVAIAKRKEDLGVLGGNGKWKRLPMSPGSRLWTDDFSNVFDVMKW